MTRSFQASLQLPRPLSAQVLRDCTNWLEAIGRERGLPLHGLQRLDICLHEALANLLNHGVLPSGSDQAEVSTTITIEQESDGSGRAMLELADTFLPFEPTAHSIPERQGAPGAPQLHPGGQGIRLILHNADRVIYTPADGRNRLSMLVQWTRPR